VCVWVSKPPLKHLLGGSRFVSGHFNSSLLPHIPTHPQARRTRRARIVYFVQRESERQQARGVVGAVLCVSQENVCSHCLIVILQKCELRNALALVQSCRKSAGDHLQNAQIAPQQSVGFRLRTRGIGTAEEKKHVVHKNKNRVTPVGINYLFALHIQMSCFFRLLSLHPLCTSYLS
jgi:hypothetical protein